MFRFHALPPTAVRVVCVTAIVSESKQRPTKMFETATVADFELATSASRLPPMPSAATLKARLKGAFNRTSAGVKGGNSVHRSGSRESVGQTKPEQSSPANGNEPSSAVKTRADGKKVRKCVREWAAAAAAAIVVHGCLRRPTPCSADVQTSIARSAAGFRRLLAPIMSYLARHANFAADHPRRWIDTIGAARRRSRGHSRRSNDVYNTRAFPD